MLPNEPVGKVLWFSPVRPQSSRCGPLFLSGSTRRTLTSAGSLFPYPRLPVAFGKVYGVDAVFLCERYSICQLTGMIMLLRFAIAEWDSRMKTSEEVIALHWIARAEVEYILPIPTHSSNWRYLFEICIGRQEGRSVGYRKESSRSKLPLWLY